MIATRDYELMCPTNKSALLSANLTLEKLAKLIELMKWFFQNIAPKLGGDAHCSSKRILIKVYCPTANYGGRNEKRIWVIVLSC